MTLIKTMKTEEFNKIEEVLKENLKSNVHIDNEFKGSLEEEILTEAQNKLISTVSMQQNNSLLKGNQTKSKISPKIFWAFGILTLLLVLGLGAYVLISQGYLGQSEQNNDVEIAETDDLAGKFALLYVNSGSVKVVRNGNETTYTDEAELLAGDKILTSEDSIADIKVNFGRIALDADSGITLNQLNDSAYPQVDYGMIFISSGSAYDGEVNARTINAEVKLEDGSTLVSQNSTAESASEVSWFKGLVQKAFATESIEPKDDSTKVISVAGTVKVVASGQEVVVDNGKEVIIKNKVAGEVAETSREAFKTEFVSTVLEKEQTDGKDLGTAGDLTAPTVTIVSPAEGTTVTDKNLTITFKSSENGWFINESPWRDIVANSENTFTVVLNPGANPIKLRVKDYSYNLTEMTLNINYQAPYAVSWAEYTPGTSGVYLSWSTVGGAAGQSYVVYRNGGYYQTFPVRDETVWGANWTDTATANGQTYTYFVKLMQGDSILATSPEISVVAQNYVAPEPPASNECSISANLVNIVNASIPSNIPSKSLIFKSYAVTQTGYKALLSWTVSGSCGEYSAYKIVTSQSPSPTYPGNNAQYISLNNNQGYTGVLTSGSWYGRVGLYNGSGCTYYSNDIIITVP